MEIKFKNVLRFDFSTLKTLVTRFLETDEGIVKSRIESSLYSLCQAEARDKWRGAHLRYIAPGRQNPLSGGEP